MKQVTKKHFKELHSTGKLWLVSACPNRYPADVYDILVDRKGDYPQHETTRASLDNYGDYSKTVATTFELRGRVFYFVTTTIDNSKCDTCSMTDTRTDVVIYIEK